MVSDVEHPKLASSMTPKKHNGKVNKGNGNRLKFQFCPCCGRKEYYKVSRTYEHCRFCGLHTILLPGQDF